MNVKKYLTMLAGAALLTACTSDEPAIGPAPDGNGQAGTPGSVTFRIDGLAGGSTVQSKAEGDNMIASAKENEIQLLDILVFAYCGASGTEPVDPTTSPSAEDLNNTAYWKLQEVHYYSANNPTDKADPFYRPAPPEVGSEGTITTENYVRQFQLQGTGTFRSATITPIKGMGADDKRYLRFVLIANSNSVYAPSLSTTNGVPYTINHPTKAADAIILKDLYAGGGHLDIDPLKNGDIISCPLPMVGNPVAGDKAYVNTNDLTTAPSKVLSMSTTLKRAVARFDIINETPHDFTLTQIEIPYSGSIKAGNLRPFLDNYNSGKCFVNLPTLDKTDENGNPYWSTTNTDAMALNSAFYTSASNQTDDTPTTIGQMLKLTVHGKIGNQSLEKEIELKVSDGAGDFTYDIAPNTRYRLRISYRGGLQALMEVVDWSDDYTNPELSNPQTPVIIAPANNVIISDGFNPDHLCPYTGWFWDDRTKYQELFPKWELGTHYAVMIPNNTNLEGTGLENSQPKEVAETLAFDIATKDETATFPFAFDIANALTPDKPNTAWLRTHTYGATQDATDKKLWHVKLVAVEGAVNNMETLDPLKIRVYDKENPEYYAFIDVLQPADYPLTTVRTKIEYGRVQTSYFSGNTTVTLPEDLVQMIIYHAKGDRICSFGAYDANGRQYENMTWAVLRKGANPADPVTVTFNPNYTGTDFSDIFLKIFPEGDGTNYYLYRLIHYSNNK